MSLDCKIRRLVFVAALVASLASPSSRARAQPPSGAAAIAPASTARPASSAVAGASVSTANSSPPTFVAPPVSDPMLAPPPPAPLRIASWNDALATIRSQSPDYLSAAQAVERAKAQKEIAWSNVLPWVNAQVTYTHELLAPLRATIGGVTIVTPPPNAWTAGGTATWSILSPRGIYGIGTAEHGIQAATFAFEDQRRLIAEAVVSTMLATLAAERTAELNRVGLRAALERSALTHARLQFGQGTALDVDRADQDVESARSLVVSGDEILRRAREALGVALGSRTAVSAPGDLDLAQFEDAVARTCRLNAEIERRPDVAAAREHAEVAERTVHDAELQFSPWIALDAAAQYLTAPVLSPSGIVALEGVLNIPIYEGGSRFAALRDSKAALEQARQALVSTRLNAVVSAAQAERAVSVLQASRDVVQAERDLAVRVDWRVRDGYARGVGTSLDLVVSGQALRQADINLALLQFQVAQARADAVLTNAECVY
jgi:outer membrane protein, multidrug efflux system